MMTDTDTDTDTDHDGAGSAVELQSVSKTFGLVPVLESVSLIAPTGQRTVIVGTSGSGKTTLLRLISGFESPDAGMIKVTGRVVAGDGRPVPPHRRGIGYVSQDGALFPHLSVGRNIAFGLKRAAPSDRGATVASMLDMVSLDGGMANRYPDELSGGQQQRVALARALAAAPKIMLLDEPFSALDSGLRSATREIVADTLERAGVTSVLVTHDRGEALAFADQLAVLRAGTLVQVGSPRAIYEQPADLFTAAFLGETVVLQAEVVSGVAHSVLGPVPVAPTSPTGAVKIMIRPEHLVMVPAQGRAVGQIIMAEYHGAQTTFMIHLESAPSLPGLSRVIKVRQPSAVTLSIGDRVDLEVSGGGPVAFAAEDR